MPLAPSAVGEGIGCSAFFFEVLGAEKLGAITILVVLPEAAFFDSCLEVLEPEGGAFSCELFVLLLAWLVWEYECEWPEPFDRPLPLPPRASAASGRHIARAAKALSATKASFIDGLLSMFQS